MGSSDEPGEVHPRVVHRVIDEGSWADDEVVCEYLGGVLAASRSPAADDDGAAWAALINRLSASTIRTHYVIYTALRQVLLDRGERPDLNSGTVLADHTLYIPWDVYTAAMGVPESLAEETAGAAVAMLDREVLIGEHWTVSFDREDPLLDLAGAPGPGLVVTPTHVGIELYLWGMGRRTMDLPTLADDDLDIDLASVVVPRGALVLP